MLDRYTIGASPESIAQYFDVAIPDEYENRYNAAPTQRLPIIMNANPEKISFCNWGLIAPMANGKSISSKLFNTRHESVKDKSSIRSAVMQRKCIIVCDGFYLWKKISKKRKIPYYHLDEEQSVFGIAGFWEEHVDLESDSISISFNMLTVPVVSKFLSYDTDVLPFILRKGTEREWLMSADTELDSYIDQSRFDVMRSYTVSPKIQDLNNDFPELRTNKPPADQLGNYTLFG